MKKTLIPGGGSSSALGKASMPHSTTTTTTTDNNEQQRLQGQQDMSNAPSNSSNNNNSSTTAVQQQGQVPTNTNSNLTTKDNSDLSQESNNTTLSRTNGELGTDIPILPSTSTFSLAGKDDKGEKLKKKAKTFLDERQKIKSRAQSLWSYTGKMCFLFVYYSYT